MNAWAIGRIAGIQLRLHPSWVIILGLLIATVASQVGQVDPTTSALQRWVSGVLVGGAFVLSSIAHELAHAIVARRRGVVVDGVVVSFLGAAVSTDLATKRPHDEIAVALAGPIASLVLGVGFLVVSLVAGLAATSNASVLADVARITLLVGVLDLSLGALNLIPAFPLDGGRVIRAIGWLRTGDATKGLQLAARSGRAMGLLLAVASVAVVVAIDPVDGLMVALCGWFLITTARNVFRGAGLDRLLEGLNVGDVMERDVATLPPSLTIDTFATQLLDGTGATALPVAEDGHVLGIIGQGQIRRLRRDRWATTRAEDLMVKTDDLPAIAPETTVRAALDDLARSRMDGLPVMIDGVFGGLVTRRGVADAVRLRAEREGATAW